MRAARVMRMFGLKKTGDTPSIWSRQYIHILLIEFACQLGIYCISPILSSYAVAMGASVAFGGFIAGVNSTAALCCRPFSGFVSDWFDKKNLLILSSVLFCIGGLGITLSPMLELVVVFRALMGVAFALKSGVLFAFVATTVPKESVGLAIGWFGLVSTVSSAISPSIGSWVSSLLGYTACFALSCLFFLGYIVLSVTIKNNQVNSDKDSKDRPKFTLDLKNFLYPPTLIISLIAVLNGIPFAITNFHIVLVGDMRGISGVTLYFVAYAITAFVSKPSMGRLTDQYGFATAVVPALVIQAIGVLVMAFADSLAMVLIFGLLMGIGHGAVYSAVQAESVRGVDKAFLGRASNTLYFGMDMNMGFTPIIAGYILETYGPTVTYLVAAGCVMACMVVVIGREMYMRRKANLSPHDDEQA